MFNTRILTLSGLLVGLAVIFQLIPGFFSEAFVFITILSGFPIYIITQLNRRLGFAAYIAVSIIVILVSVHEGIFFICTNGIIGFSMGFLRGKLRSKSAVSAWTAAAVVVMLFVLNYLIGINIFDYSILKSPVAQIISLFCFLFLYCVAYLNSAIRIYDTVRKTVHLNN
ncbi:MAG: hypothetical protein ACM3TR_16075 [Caulobacteraceae bacterium]